jgi:hypothetical protein
MGDMLSQKYPELPGSKPVERAVQAQLRAGEAGPGSKSERVDAYMERLERILDSEQRGERGMDPYAFLKTKLLKSYTLDTADSAVVQKVAEGLYESEKRIAIERGQGAVIEKIQNVSEVVEKYKPLVLEKAEQQRTSLSAWLDYLQENDGSLPMWFRYYVVRSLGNMGSFDKEKLAYNKRSPASVAPFPELNSEAIGFVYVLLEQGVDVAKHLSEEKKPHLAKLLQSKDFPKLYAFAQVEMAGKADRTSIEGEWKKYEQGSDYRKLESDLEGKGTGWCTAQGSAKYQLEGGDFYVYYSKSASGANTEPRIAIRMEQDQVGEVRGIAPRQELEPALVETAQEKYKDLPGGDKYEKKASDMKRVTAIAKKMENKEPLTRDELIFLYEIDSTIESFGYERDPRIEELRKQRDPKIDAPIVLECEPKQIATNEKEITTETKAYIGPLCRTALVNHIENIYVRFPDRKIHQEKVEVDYSKSLENMVADGKHDYKNVDINIKNFPRKRKAQTTLKEIFSKEQEKADLEVIAVDFNEAVTTEQAMKRLDELGLRPATIEELLALGAAKPDLQRKFWIVALGSSFVGSDGYRRVPFLRGRSDARGLDLYFGSPDWQWDGDSRFLAVRK